MASADRTGAAIAAPPASRIVVDADDAGRFRREALFEIAEAADEIKRCIPNDLGSLDGARGRVREAEDLLDSVGWDLDGVNPNEGPVEIVGGTVLLCELARSMLLSATEHLNSCADGAEFDQLPVALAEAARWVAIIEQIRATSGEDI